MQEHLDKIDRILKVDEDPKGVLFDHIEESEFKFKKIESEIFDIRDFVEDAIASKIDGVDGLEGPQGPVGPQGPIGPRGPKGEKGEQGFNGLDGVDGKDGRDGIDGKDGEKGEKGDKGDKGDAPDHEWDGTALRFEKPNGEWGDWVDLQGKKGKDGQTYSIFGGGGGGIDQSSADKRYLQILNNLSDLDDVSTARTNLGLVAGGTGDIWIQKAGGTMAGNFNMGGNTLFGSTASGGNLTLSSTTDATKGSIFLGESLEVAPDGSGVGNTSFGVITWARGTRLYEQGGGADPERFFFLANGDRYEVLSEDGVTFLFSANGPNSANPNRFITYQGICSSSYATTAPPSNGAIFSGNLGVGTNSPSGRLHVKGATNTFAYFDGTANFGSFLFRNSAGSNRGYLGYSTTGGYVNNSLNNAMHIRGENGISFGYGATKSFDLAAGGYVYFGPSAASTKGRVTIEAGSTTVAPFVLNAGSVLTTEVAGAMEYDGDWWVTKSGNTRLGVSTTLKTDVSQASSVAHESLDLEASSSQDAVNTSPTGTFITGDMTIEGWINVETYTSGSVICAQNSSGEAESQNVLWYLALSGSDELVWLHESSTGTNNFATSSGVNVQTATWTHIAVVRDTTNKVIKFYKNGTFIGNVAYTNNATGGGDTDLYVGSNLSANLFFDGKIKDLRIWDDMRTADEIDFYKDKALDGDEDNLVAYFKFDGDYTDSTANNNDLTANNAPVFSSDVPTIFDKLLSYEVPADVLQSAGDFLQIDAFGTFAANANNKDVLLAYGTDVIQDTGVGGANNEVWAMKAKVLYTSAGNQKAIARQTTSAAPFSDSSTYTETTQDTTGVVEIACYGMGVADDDVVQEGLVIEYAPGQ